MTDPLAKNGAKVALGQQRDHEVQTLTTDRADHALAKVFACRTRAGVERGMRGKGFGWSCASDQDEDAGVERQATRRDVPHRPAAPPPAAGNPAEQAKGWFGLGSQDTEVRRTSAAPRIEGSAVR